MNSHPLLFLKNRAALITQMCLVGSAIFVGFGFPLVFGLSAYGLFAASTALTFIIQKATDLTIESVLIENSLKKLLFSTLISFSLILSLAAILIHIYPDSRFDIDYALLATMVSSTLIINLIFMKGTAVSQMAYAVFFILTTILFTAIFRLSFFDNISLLLILINISGTVFGIVIVFFIYRHASRQTVPNLRVLETTAAKLSKPRELVGEFINRFLFASLTLLVSFGSVLIASNKLSDPELGALRLFASIVLIGYWITPINPKAFYAIASSIDTPQSMTKLFDEQWVPFTVLLIVWFFSIIIIRLLFSDINTMSFIGAICIYPCVLFVSVFDKSLLSARGLSGTAPLIGLYAFVVFIGLLNAETLYQYEIVLGVAMICYPLVMVLLLARSFLSHVALPVTLAICAAGVLFGPGTIGPLIASTVFLAIIFLLARKT